MLKVKELMGPVVSIPFREELHSDTSSFSAGMISPPCVSIPFREELHSDHVKHIGFAAECAKFPSLSGKSSIRTGFYSGIES